MSAEILRRAAKLMRERAEATAGEAGVIERWEADSRTDGRAWLSSVNDGHMISMHGFNRTCEHIAGWHPVVALAVVEWLDWMAQCREVMDGIAANVRAQGREPQGPGKPTAMFLEMERRALVVARAYLREPA